jgi:hypothetical protein
MGAAGLTVPAEAGKRSCFKTARRESEWPFRGRVRRRPDAPGWRGPAKCFTSCPSGLGSGACGWSRQQFTRTLALAGGAAFQPSNLGPPDKANGRFDRLQSLPIPLPIVLVVLVAGWPCTCAASCLPGIIMFRCSLHSAWAWGLKAARLGTGASTCRVRNLVHSPFSPDLYTNCIRSAPTTPALLGTHKLGRPPARLFCTPVHLRICTSAHLHTCTSAHPHSSTPPLPEYGPLQQGCDDAIATL